MDDLDRFLAAPPGLRFAFAVKVKVGPIQDFGVTAAGHRRVIDILGGEVDGPGLSGSILPGGADWQMGHQLWVQLQTVVTTIVWAAVGTAIAIYVAKLVTGLRVSTEVEREGLDLGEHGGRAYNY